MNTPSPPSPSPTTTPYPESKSPSPSNQKLTLIVAYSLPTYSIGLNGKLPWYYPDDLKLFKQLTRGHTVIMGRKTWYSLPDRKPLPNRTNIIVSRNSVPIEQLSTMPSVWVANSLEKAIALASLFSCSSNTFLIGGASLYKEALSKGLMETVIATEINHHHPGDVFFSPPLNLATWQHTDTLLTTPDFTTKVYTPKKESKET